MPVTTTYENQTIDQPPKAAYQKKKAIFRTYQIIWYVLGVIETLLGFRFILKLFGANPASGFASLIYGLSGAFTVLFTNLFGNSVAGRNIIEWSTLVAMIVYLVVAYGLVRFFQFIKPTTPEEVEEGTEV